MKDRLLFVDDDRLVLATLGKGLRQAGYIVETADSGRAALDLAASASFGLAIVDIHMPGMSGLELASILRDTHGLATLFVSACSEKKIVEEAAHVVGGIGYVVKPVDITQLDFLIARDCDAVQGYLFSKPLPPQDFVRLLQQDQLLKQSA